MTGWVEVLEVDGVARVSAGRGAMVELQNESCRSAGILGHAMQQHEMEGEGKNSYRRHLRGQLSMEQSVQTLAIEMIGGQMVTVVTVWTW